MTRTHVKHRAEPAHRTLVRSVVGIALVGGLMTGGVAQAGTLATTAQTDSSAVSAAASVAQAPVAGTELVVNGQFSQALTGWFSSGGPARLVVVAGSSGPYARLTPTATRTVVLNDVDNTVTSTPSGSSFRVSAKVRSAGSPLYGQVRVREVASGQVRTHAGSFRATSDGWTTVTFEFTTTMPGATLDLNVLAWRVAAGQSLEVDDVSMLDLTGRAVTPSPQPTPSPSSTPSPSPSTSPSPSPTSSPSPSPSSTPSPTPTTQPPSRGDARSCSGAVPSGTLFGTSMSYDGRTPQATLNDLDNLFGHDLEVLRLFDPNLPASWSSARAAATSDRTVVISFRPMPKDVLAGKYDSQLKAFFTQAPSNQTIYWSYIHEPEPLIDNGTFTADQYRRAWQRIASFADAACKPNMHATLILTGWTADPGSKRDWRTYYAGSGVIDVIAWDPYNGVHDPNRTYYASAESLFGNVVKIHQQSGIPFGIAETGSRLIPGDSGSGRAAWLKEIGTYLERNGAVFVSYFQSTRDANWELLDKPSRTAWGSFMS